MDKIFLTKLEVETVIGIWEWEKRLPQKVVFDLELSTDIKKAASSDSINDALDYKAVSKRIKAIASENQFELIETLAETIAQAILDEFEVNWLKLKVSKPFAIRDSKNVGLIIERTK
jgi:dihydroneopterin aldolase|tara:strand:+ start:55 stop:405 length:351 start_codon:yes stop_codon:yes gene_type:complete